MDIFLLPNNLVPTTLEEAQKQKECCQHIEAVFQTEKVICLYGADRIAVLDIAAQYARKAKVGRKYAITWNDTVKDTLLSLPFDEFCFIPQAYMRETDIHNERYRQIKAILKENFDDGLLVIDAYEADNIDRTELNDLNVKALFLTSYPIEGCPCICINDSSNAPDILVSMLPDTARRALAICFLCESMKPLRFCSYVDHETYSTIQELVDDGYLVQENDNVGLPYTYRRNVQQEFTVQDVQPFLDRLWHPFQEHSITEPEEFYQFLGFYRMACTYFPNELNLFRYALMLKDCGHIYDAVKASQTALEQSISNPENTKRQLARAYCLTGNLLSQAVHDGIMGAENNDKAVEYLQTALSLFESANIGQSDYDYLATQFALIIHLINIGKLDVATSLAEKVLQLCKEKVPGSKAVIQAHLLSAMCAIGTPKALEHLGGAQTLLAMRNPFGKRPKDREYAMFECIAEIHFRKVEGATEQTQKLLRHYTVALRSSTSWRYVDIYRIRTRYYHETADGLHHIAGAYQCAARAFPQAVFMQEFLQMIFTGKHDRDRWSKNEWGVWRRFLMVKASSIKEALQDRHTFSRDTAVVMVSSYPLDEKVKERFDSSAVPYIFLQFDDVEDEHSCRTQFTDDMAIQVKCFIDLLSEERCYLSFLCDSGQSRSPALAAAILRRCYTDRNDLKVFLNPHMKPNLQVYETMCKILNIPVEKHEITFRKALCQGALHYAIRKTKYN